MRRYLACFLLVLSAATAHAGADLNLVYKGSPASADIVAMSTSRDLYVAGDGTGASKLRSFRAANPKGDLLVYVKASGVRKTDAEWGDAVSKGLLWTQANGEPYTQSQNGWAFGNVQQLPHQWAEVVVIPHVAAALAGLEPGVVTGILVDNTTWQDPTLFNPRVPDNFSARGYHDGTLSILLRLRGAFPGLKLFANGYQGGAPDGLRGEALGSSSPNYVDGIWFECWYASCGGKPRDASRFARDQAALMGFVAAGKSVVVDEAGLTPFTPLWREALGIFIATTGRVGRWDNAYFNLSSAPWGDWWR